MSATLIISVSPYLIRVGLMAGGELQELMILDPHETSIAERYLWGRVTNLDKRLDAAFIDCGLEQPAYLAAKDARIIAGKPKRTPINEILNEGQYLLVQGLRDPDGDKGARVTADLSIFGAHLTLRPRHSGIELSPKVPASKRGAFMDRGQSLLPEAGFIVRENFDDADNAAIGAEAQRLQDQWAQLQNAAENAGKPTLLPALDKPMTRIARYFAQNLVNEVIIDDPSLKGPAANAFKSADITIAPRGEAFTEAGIGERLESLLASRVPLPSGGSLVIQPTLAATMIDVDGAGESALPTNLEAAREIARQIRLRNVGGTIIVDFIDLGRAHDRKTLDTALKNACRRDRMPVQIYPMSPLGIVELSRAKRGRSLAEWYKSTCAVCQASGLRPSHLAQAEAFWTHLQALRQPARKIELDQALDAFIRKWSPEVASTLAARKIDILPNLSGGWRIVE
jgi:ribonuclease E/ribonuclease G